MKTTTETAFSLNNLVLVTSGFYKGFKGNILDYEVGKNSEIIYKVKLKLPNNSSKEERFNQEQLKKAWF